MVIYVKIAISLMAGIIFAGYINIIACIQIFSILIFGLIILKIRISGIKNYWFLVAGAFILGGLIAQISSGYTIRDLYPLDDKFITVNGYVSSIPEEIEDGRYSYTIRVNNAEYLGKTYDVDENIRLSSDKRLEYSQNVNIRGFLKRINEKKNHSDFDYNRYYKSKGIFYKISDYEVEGADIKSQWGVRHVTNLLRIKANDFIDTYFDGNKGAILKAVIIGNKKAFSKEYKDILYKTNTMRMFYPAYLHILLILGIVNILLPFLQRSKREYIIIFAMVIYAMFNFEYYAGIKSAVLMIVTILTLKRKGYSHYPDILSVSLITILITNPLIIYNCGFIMSVTTGILFFLFKEYLFDALGFIKSIRTRRLIIAFLVTVVGVMPISAYFFYGTSLYGVFISYIYMFCVILLMGLFWLLCGVGLIFPNGLFLDELIDLVLTFMEKIPYAVERLPYSLINIGRPSVIAIILFYILVWMIRIICIDGFKNFKVMSLVAILIGGFLSFGIYEVIHNTGTHVTFVNVGQGDGSYIRLSSGEIIVVDGGGGEDYSDYDAGEEIFLPYLKSEGIFNIDVAVVTHYHKDHCLGTIAALKNLNVKSIIMPGVMPENEYRVLIEELCKKQGTDIYYVEKGDKVRFDSGAVLEVLSPYQKEYDDENDTSIVFMLSDNDYKMLYMADATVKTEEALKDEFMDVDLVKIGHHGSSTSTSEEFLDIIKPEIAVLTVGENNSFGLPSYDVLQRLQKRGIKIFRTDKMGDISFIVYKNKKIIYNVFKNS